MTSGIIPEVVVCGEGIDGVEMVFGFKTRWNEIFGQEIKVTLCGYHDKPCADLPEVVRD